jgi:hypothetical protein
MARGYYRKQRYIVRTIGGRGIGASSVSQVKKLAQEHEIDYIETDIGNISLEELTRLPEHNGAQDDSPAQVRVLTGSHT